MVGHVLEIKDVPSADNGRSIGRKGDCVSVPTGPSPLTTLGVPNVPPFWNTTESVITLGPLMFPPVSRPQPLGTPSTSERTNLELYLVPPGSRGPETRFSLI